MKMIALVGDERALADGEWPFREAETLTVEPDGDSIVEHSDGKTVVKRGPVVVEIQKVLDQIDQRPEVVVQFLRFPTLGLNALRWTKGGKCVVQTVGPSPVKLRHAEYGEKEFLEAVRPFAVRRLGFREREIELKNSLDIREDGLGI